MEHIEYKMGLPLLMVNNRAQHFKSYLYSLAADWKGKESEF